MNNILKAPKLLKNTFSSKGSPMSLYLCETDKWRPTELIHYFDQNGNYIESKLKTQQCDRFLTTTGYYPHIASYSTWKPSRKKPYIEVFDINTRMIPQDPPTHLIFWNAVKEGFARRDPFVKTGDDCGNFYFYVQYLVKDKVGKKPAAKKPSTDLLAE